MQLYFLRHAEAEPSFGNDHERNLTSKGIRRTKTAAQVLLRLDINPKIIYTSPRVRARQTAEIVGDALNIDVDIRDEVNFDFSLEAVEVFAAGLEDDDEVMFVGHNPSMSTVVSDLTGADVSLKKGGLARVDVVMFASPMQGQLVWLIAPKVFDALR